LFRAIGLAAILFGFWLAISGHYTPLLMGLGAGSSVLVVYLAVRMDVVDHEGVPFQFGIRFWLYLPWLMKEIFVANVAVAKIILNPKLPISPIMVHYRCSQKTDAARVLFANSVTLTPGTITTNITGNDLEIHALTFADVIQGHEEDDMDLKVAWVEGA